MPVYHENMSVFVFHVMSVATEEIRIIPGNQTMFDLSDLVVGVSYGVSVTALVGENEGDPVTVYITPGGLNEEKQSANKLLNINLIHPLPFKMFYFHS